MVIMSDGVITIGTGRQPAMIPLGYWFGRLGSWTIIVLNERNNSNTFHAANSFIVK